MSALCCAAPGLVPNGNGAPSQSVYYPFTRSYLDLNPYAAAAAAAAAAMETASRQSTNPPIYHHPQPQIQQQQQQQQQQHVSSARRRKRLEHALAETIPAASSGKVSQRIAQLQHRLETVPRHPLLPASAAPRPLSLDPAKDYSQALSVDCSIEYDLPRVARPPPGAQPLLLIAPRREVVRQPAHQQHQWPQSQALHSGTSFMAYTAPVSSCSSDSGRGTDSERGSSPAFGQLAFNGSWMQQQPPSMQPWITTSTPSARHIKVNYQKSVLPVHPRPADAVRIQQRSADMSGCPCCPARPTPVAATANVQRWAPYSTTARHACPAPAGPYQQQQQQPQWTRWNGGHQQHDPSMTYLNNASLMAFHV